ncbi:MAG: glycosyltransferase family 4 protein [bacterium]
MKILLMAPELNVGGVETHVVSLAQGMVGLGHEVMVVSNGGALVPKLKEWNVEHLSMPVHSKSPVTIRKMAGEIRKVIHARGFDIVHAHSRVPAWIAYFATRGEREVFVVTAHGQYAPHFGSRVMAWGDRVICVSRVIRNHMVELLDTPPLNTTVIYNAIDVQEVEEIRRHIKPPEQLKGELGLPPDAPLIGVIARLTATKGVRHFLEALALLRREMAKLHGLVVGDGPLRNELQETAHSLGLENSVVFSGVRTDVYDILNALDVYVVPSIYEGFSLGSLEALSCGVPIVATRVGGVPEVLTDGETALLAEPRSGEALAEKVRLMLTQPELRRRLVDAGGRVVREKFSKEKMIASVAEVYQEAIEEKKSSDFKLQPSVSHFPSPVSHLPSSHPRVLLTLPELNVGGVETHVLDLARGLKRLGYRPLVVSFGGKLVDALERSGIDHLKLPVHSKSPPVIFNMTAKMRKIIRRNRVQIVHAHSRVPAWICYLGLRNLGIPFITTAHSTYSVHLGSRVMVWSDFTIAVSGYVREHMVKNFGASPQRVAIVYNGVSFTDEAYAEAVRRGAKFRDEWGVRDGAPVIGMVAALTPRKGYMYFLQSARDVLSEFPDALFLAVGGGVQKEELEGMRDQLCIPRERFRFLGVRADVRALLAAMDIFMLSSTSEGLPYVILEAMAMGKPIISTNVGGIPEAITDGVEGRLVTPGSAEGLTDALLALLRQPEEMQRMSAAARKKVSETFSVDKMVEETEKIYRSII